MLSEFIQTQLEKARYKILKDGTYFGEIPSIQGVWANAENLENCREELREVLEDWILLKIRDKEQVAGLTMGAETHRRSF